MRIARILVRDPEEDVSHEVLALERNGALYSVPELDRHVSGDPLHTSEDLHVRLFSLGGAGLFHHDERLKAGDRPTEARILPGSFTWLPPCDTSRALFVRMAPHDHPSIAPVYGLGSARGLLGHDEIAMFPSGVELPDVEVGIAAVMGEDIERATPGEAERAIFGYTIACGWVSRAEAPWDPTDRASSLDAGARDFAAQLGPVLVSRDEIADPSALRVEVRAGGQTALRGATSGARFSIAASIAHVSHRVPLCAGDVIALGCVAGGTLAAVGGKLEFGTPIEVLVERLGKLKGRAAPALR